MSSTTTGPARLTCLSPLGIARFELGLTQAGLGERVGLAAESISRLEHGHVRPTLASASALSRELKMPIAELFPENTNAAPQEAALAEPDDHRVRNAE